MSEIFILLIIFQIKHFLADFPMQGKYMLGKFKLGFDWIAPLGAHCLVHALFTALIVFWYLPPKDYWYLPVIDFVIHFIQDRIKASPNILGRWKPDNKYFWWALGQDQMVHHLTHYWIISEIISNV